MSPPPSYSNIISNARTTAASDEPASPDALRKAFLKNVFEVASQPEARDANRKKMYAFWKTAVAEDVDVEAGGDLDAS